MGIDYQDLLRRYIAHVIDCEGCDYVRSGYWPEPWSLEERGVLSDMAKDAWETRGGERE